MELNWHYSENQSQSIKEFLWREKIPKSFIKAVKYSGGEILLNKRAVTVRAQLNKGDYLKLIAPDEQGHDTVIPSELPIDVVYEDRDYLIINKPSNAVSIPSFYEPNSSMANRVKGYYVRKNYADQVIHIVTRLDRDTTGLMLIGKHRLAHTYMDRVLQAKQLTRTYYALSHRKDWAEHGFINRPIGRNPDSLISRMVDETGQVALTEYWLMEDLEEGSFLKLQLHTGRTHQIRVHLAYEGGPLIGDDLYGGIKYPEITRQALHCGELSFIHPFTKEAIHIVQPIPGDMLDWMGRQERSK